MLRRLLSTATAALTLVAASCGGDLPTEPTEPAEPVYSDPVTAVYAPTLGVDIATMTKTPSGLYYRDRLVGTDTAIARPTSRVTVTYAGYVPTGRKFDSGTAPFPLDSVIAGFREGISGMRVGGERTLVIPPALGYGNRPPDSRIPANSVLVFDVKLNSIR